MKVNDLKKGLWVACISSHGGEIEVGRVKSWNDKWIFVVYKCDNNWDQYEDYTAAATDINDLICRAPIVYKEG